MLPLKISIEFQSIFSYLKRRFPHIIVTSFRFPLKKVTLLVMAQRLSAHHPDVLPGFERKSRHLAIVVILLALLVLTGWQFDIELLKRPFPHVMAMNPVSAVCFLVIGISVLLLKSKKRGGLIDATVYFLAIIPLAAALFRLSEGMWSTGVEFDTILFNKKIQADPAGNHMSAVAAINFLLLGLSVIFSVNRSITGQKISNYFSLVILLVSLFAIIGYLYRVEEFHNWLSNGPMALHSAAGFMLIGLSILFSNANAAFMAIISHQTSGGMIARILIPTTILVPVIMGYIRLIIQSKFPMSIELGVDFLTTGIILLFFVLILYASSVINKKDNLRKAAEKKLERANNELEQKVIEGREELYRNEKRFRTLIENSFDVITLLNEKLDIIYLSPSFERLTGFAPEERKNKNGLTFVHPDELEKTQCLITEVMQNQGTPVLFQNRILHKNGTYIWVEGVLTNLLYDRSVEAIVANYRDVTERKEAEENLKLNEIRFRSIIEQFPYPVVTYNRDGVSTGANKAWEDLWEDKRENAQGYNIRTDPQFTQSGLSYYVEKAFAGEIAHAPPYLYDPALIGKKGRKRWIQMVLYPLKDSTGKMAEVILILLDLTANKKAEEKLIASEQQFRTLNAELEDRVLLRTTQLQEANKELEAFSYTVSHDLRAPLRSINAYSHILEEDYSPQLDTEGKRILRSIISNARRMNHLIDDLLDFSKIGKAEIRKNTVNMTRLVKEVIDELRHSGMTIPVQLLIQDLPPAQCDGILIKQVWVNLISNAIKYSAIREIPIIEIGTREADNSAVYYVKDNGAGFDMQYYHKLFGVFERLHTSEQFSGTGVGLAIVKRIVARHGGAVWAESKLNEGATFYFSLVRGSS